MFLPFKRQPMGSGSVWPIINSAANIKTLSVNAIVERVPRLPAIAHKLVRKFIYVFRYLFYAKATSQNN